MHPGPSKLCVRQHAGNIDWWARVPAQCIGTRLTCTACSAAATSISRDSSTSREYGISVLSFGREGLCRKKHTSKRVNNEMGRFQGGSEQRFKILTMFFKASVLRQLQVRQDAARATRNGETCRERYCGRREQGSMMGAARERYQIIRNTCRHRWHWCGTVGSSAACKVNTRHKPETISANKPAAAKGLIQSERKTEVGCAGVGTCGGLCLCLCSDFRRR